jgi:hypothetical protein
MAEYYFRILFVLVLPHSTLLICGFSAFSTVSPATIHKYLKMFAIVSIFYNSLIAILGITNITKSSLGVSVIYHCYLVLGQTLLKNFELLCCACKDNKTINAFANHIFSLSNLVSSVEIHLQILFPSLLG